MAFTWSRAKVAVVLKLAKMIGSPPALVVESVIPLSPKSMGATPARRRLYRQYQ
jgi:hypothetical protein